MGQAKKGRVRLPPSKASSSAASSAASSKRGSSQVDTSVPAEPSPPVSWNTVVAFCVVLAGALAFAVTAVGLVRRMFDQRFSWSLLDSTNKRLSRATYSESSLYFTFLEEYTQAPSFFDAVAGALRDNKTEYPDVINPLSRFNIWQEIMIGQMWRSGFKQYFEDPLDLMIESIFVMQGVSYVGMIVLAWYLGGANLFALACGFVAIASYAHIAATEQINCFRAVQFPILRENYSVPFMWYQLLVLCNMLRAGASNTLPQAQARGCWKWSWGWKNTGLFVATSLMLTGWQFAPFLLLLQVGALLATFIAGYASLKTVAHISRILGAAVLFVGAIVTMGNVMLLTAPVVFVIGAIDVASRRKLPAFVGSATDASESKTFVHAATGVLQRLGLVLLVVIAAFVVKFFIMSLLGLQDDAHIMNILKFKLSGFSIAFEDFQTLLYVCSGAYQVMKPEDLQFLEDMEQLPTRFGAMLVVVAAVVLIELKRSGNGIKSHKALDPALVFAIANGILLSGLFALIQRLSSVGVPFLCVVVAQAASPSHFGSVADALVPPSDASSAPTAAGSITASPTPSLSEASNSNMTAQKPKASAGRSSLLRLAFIGLGLASAGWFSQQAYESMLGAQSIVLPKIEPPQFPRITNDMKAALKLTQFVEESIPANAALGGDAPILSRIRLMTHRPILNHPHAEHKARRVREEQLYQVFNRWTEQEVWQQLRILKVDYFVFSLGPCNLQCTLPDGRHFDMVYLVNATNSLGEPGRGHAEVEQFCFWVYTQQHYLTYFEVVHDGMPFWVVKVYTPEEAKARAATLKKVQQLRAEKKAEAEAKTKKKASAK